MPARRWLNPTRRMIDRCIVRYTNFGVGFEFRGINRIAVHHFDNTVFEIGDWIANDLVDECYVIGFEPFNVFQISRTKFFFESLLIVHVAYLRRVLHIAHII